MTQRIVKYVLFFLLNVCLLDVAVYFLFLRDLRTPAFEAKACGTLPEKLEFYKHNRGHYNVVYFGDSRTFSNINNVKIDSALNTNSYNIAMWANWFPNQYSFLQDFLPLVPDSTVLVYSIGHQNFVFGDELQDSYPIDSKKAEEYYTWGFTISDLKKPIRQSGTIPSANLFLCQGEVNAWFSKKMRTYLAVLFPKQKKPAASSAAGNEEMTLHNSREAAAIKSSLEKNPEVERINDFKNGDTITSIEVFWKKGNYTRIEIDSLFYRNMQRKNIISTLDKMKSDGRNTFSIDPRFWKNFEAIAGILKQHQKRLKIVFNEIGEAPNNYVVNNRRIYEEVMNATVKPYVIDNGFPYLQIDVKDLSDAYYFDYNHLNSRGSYMYSQRLTDALRPYIR